MLFSSLTEFSRLLPYLLITNDLDFLCFMNRTFEWEREVYIVVPKKGKKWRKKGQSAILSVVASFFAFFHPFGEAYRYYFEILTLVGVGLVMDLCSSWALHALLSFFFFFLDTLT